MSEKRYKRFKHIDQALANKAECALDEFRLRAHERVGCQFAISLGRSKALIIERYMYGWKFYRVVKANFPNKVLLTPEQGKLAVERGIHSQRFSPAILKV
ncbi:MAG: hypothetical protein HWE30_18715 [Methylocystaceae bacterium]|nr:hypothetical protein [Methylocystaceae bacterium]NVK20725.1 hypothetical protein [Methylocystaceae bacterium]